MAWYWQIWLLVAFAIIAVVWKLVWLIIRDRTEYVFLQFIDTASGEPIPDMDVYASTAYLSELNQKDAFEDVHQVIKNLELKRIGKTDLHGCIHFKNRWITINQLIIPDFNRVFRYQEDFFGFRSFPENPKVLKV